MSSSATLPEPIDSKPLSEGERIVDTFVAPSKTFTDIRRNGSWWAPWLLMAMVGLTWVYEVDKKIGMATVAENQLALSPKQAAKVEQMPPDQRTSQMEITAKLTRIFLYAYPVITLIVCAFFAGILLGTFKLGLGADLKFKECYAITMYAFLPGTIKALLSILIVALGSVEGFTFANPIASNLGGLVDPNSAFLHSILMSIDVFTIWTLVLTALGYSCLTSVKRSTCMGVTFGWWAVFVLVTSGFGTLFAV